MSQFIFLKYLSSCSTESTTPGTIVKVEKLFTTEILKIFCAPDLFGCLPKHMVSFSE